MSEALQQYQARCQARVDAALQALLARLPEGDARREAIVRQLAQAQ